MSSKPDNDFPPDYDERIERVCREAAAEFRSCRDALLAQVRVCCRYFESGEREGISHEEERFWLDIEDLGRMHGSELVERYRRIFDEYVAGRAAYTC
jgi:hypothetical protein